MKYDCTFNKQTDIQPVAEGLSTDLKLAIETGVIADTGIMPEYNHIDDPCNIHGKIGDAFDAIEAQKKLLSSAKAASSTNAAPQSVAASQSTSTSAGGQTE